MILSNKRSFWHFFDGLGSLGIVNKSLRVLPIFGLAQEVATEAPDSPQEPQPPQPVELGILYDPRFLRRNCCTTFLYYLVVACLVLLVYQKPGVGGVLVATKEVVYEAVWIRAEPDGKGQKLTKRRGRRSDPCFVCSERKGWFISVIPIKIVLFLLGA